MHHPIALRGLALSGPRSTTPLVVCPPVDPMQRLFSDLRGAGGGGALTLAAPARRGANLKLFQPVHHVLNIALLDLACEIPGDPRLDPRKVLSAGLVIRRVRTVTRRDVASRPGAGQDGRARRQRELVPRQETIYERWVVDGGRVLGWQPVVDSLEDPDPTHRVARSTGHASLDHALALRRARRAQATWEERSSPCFVAPPDVCQALGRTIVYGIVPTASSEISPGTPTTYDRTLVNQILSPFLQAAPARYVPWALQTIDATATRTPASGTVGDDDGFVEPAREDDVLDYLDALTQVRFLLGAFDPTNAHGAALRTELAALYVMVDYKKSVPLLDHLEEASDALIGAGSDAGGALLKVTQPFIWPEIDAARATRIADITAKILADRSAAVPGEGRFEDRDALYVAIPFARVRPEPGCPPRLVWGPETEKFEIAPWFEGTPDGAPVARIMLPDLTRDKVKQLAPNVAFLLPPSVKAFLDANNPKDILAGDVKEGDGGLGIQFICAFNIPIITLCAFILLWILIILLNIVFWWIPFVIVCLPFPKKEDS